MRKGLKITLYICCSLLLLVLGSLIFLNSRWGQNYVKVRAENYLRNKLKTEVHLGNLGYSFPKYVLLKDVLLLDQSSDTLLAAAEVKLDLNMLALFHKELILQQVLLTGIHAHIYRNQADSSYNFSYIIQAFSGSPSSTSKAKDTTASSFKMEIDLIKLDDIHFRFDDHAGGILFALYLNHSDISVKKLDLSNMFFHIKEMSAEGLQTTILQDSSWLPKKPNDTAKTDFQLVADNVNLKQIGVQFKSSVSKIEFAMNAGNVQLALNGFELENSLIDVKKLVVDNSDVSVTLGKRSLPPSNSTASPDSSVSWIVKASDVAGNNLHFIMDDNNSAPVTAGIDYSHLNIKNGSINVHNFLYNGDTTRAIVSHFTGKEQSGIDIKELRTAFNYNPQGAELNNLYFQTPYTLLQNHIGVHYPSLSALYKNMQLLQLSINLKNSTLGIKDLLVFAPDLQKQEQFRKIKDKQFKLDAEISGPLNDLRFAHFYGSGLQNTELLMSGRLTGIPVTNKIGYNLNITKFQSSRNDISLFLPDSVMAMVRIPERFGAIGQIAGNMQDVKTEMYLMSSDGMAYAKGMVATSPGKNREKYDIFLRATGLNLGKILKQDSLLGFVTATISAKGTSFDLKTMTAEIDGEIASAEVKGYPYHNIKLSAKVDAQLGNINFLSADTNLQVQFTAEADFSGKYASAKGDVQIDSIDFKALKLYSSELRARGKIHFDFPVLNPDYPQGTFVWWKPVINAQGHRYFLDSMYITSKQGSDASQNINANLDLLTATMTGKTPLTKIWPIIQEHIRRHFQFSMPDSNLSANATIKKPMKDTSLPAAYNLALNVRIIDKPILHGLLPGLTSFDSIHLNANLQPDQAKLNVSSSQIVYGTTTIENAAINVTTADSAFTYKVAIDKVAQSNIVLYDADIHGKMDKGLITANISLSDEKKQQQFALSATMQSGTSEQIIELQPGLMLNYKAWDVAQPNKIVIGKDGFYVQNFQISNSGQYIKAASNEARANTPLKIDIAGFQLSNVTDVLSHRDTLLAGGVLAGSVTIDQMSPAFKLTGDLGIQQLSILGDTLGSLKLLVNNRQDNVLDTKITLLGHGNDLVLNGAYYLQTNNGNDFNFDLDVNALALHSFESIAQNQVRNSSGFLRGQLNAKGTLNAPVITGEITTDKLVTTVSQLNAEFKMPSEKIEFTGTGLSFTDFTIHDSADNKALFNGSINTTDLSNISMDMKVTAKNWRALHSTAKDNKTFFGNLFLTADLDIKGPVTTPSVEGSLKVLKGTNVTFVNPETAPELQASKGIVEFVNMKDTGKHNYLATRSSDTVTHKRKVGADFNVNITVDKTAQFSLIVDQASGDFLSVKGDATLNATVTPGGTMSLAGSYEIHDGSYQLNYNFIKRKFAIKEGSTITFAGDPVTGTNLDITATYEVQAAPYDLMQREITDATQQNYFKQRLPFHVDLHMKGEMMKPVLTFDVVLPENKVYPLAPDLVEMIQGKLNQVRLDTSELNKQVFAVLILSRFVSDDPFRSGAASSPTFMALQSASTFIGEQLNQAAGKLIKGVDFSVDLAATEDYTSGNMQQRTDLKLAASKQLLNNRLKLTVGNDFELQGPQTANNQNSAIPTNLAADYMITADGKYSVRGYRKVYDEGILEGFVTETGLNFIVNLNYNHFKDLFMKKKKEQEHYSNTTNKK